MTGMAVLARLWRAISLQFAVDRIVAERGDQEWDDEYDKGLL